MSKKRTSTNPPVSSNTGENEFLQDSRSTGLDELVGKPTRKGSSGIGYKTTGTHFMNPDDYTPYTNPNSTGEAPFAFDSDYDLSRAQAQTGGEQAWNVTKRILPNIGLEFINQLGNTLDVEDYVGTDEEIGNWLSTWATDMKAQNNEANPVYRTNPGEALDFGDSGWLFENGSSLVESASAFVGLGYLTGGASLKALTKGATALEWLGAIGKGAAAADKGQKAIRAGSALASSVMLNQAEGVGVAVDVYQKAYAQELEKLQLEGELDGEALLSAAKTTASEKAASALRFNRLNILLNLSSAAMLIKAPSLTRATLSAPTLAKAAKSVAAESFQELAEEEINLIAEKQALADRYSFKDAAKAVSSDEGIEAGLLGMVGGAGQTSLTNATKGVKYKRNSEGKRYSANDELRASASHQEGVNKMFDKVTKATTFEDVKNAYSSSEHLFNLQSELQDQLDKGEVRKANDTKDAILYTQAYTAFEAGSTDALIGYYEAIEKADEETVEAKGFDKKTYRQEAKKAIKKIEGLERAFNKSRKYINADKVYEADAQAQAFRDRQEELTTILSDTKGEVIRDLTDLGVKGESYEFDEHGNFKFIDKKDFTGGGYKAAASELESLGIYKLTKAELKKNKARLYNKIKAHTKLTSKETQASIKEEIAEKRREEKKTTAKAKIQAKQNTAKTKAKKQTKKHTETTKNTEVVEETVVEEATPEEDMTPTETPATEGTFVLANEAQIPIVTKMEKQLNGMIVDPKFTTDTKIAILKKAVETAATVSPDEHTGHIAQYNRVIRELTAQSELEKEETVSQSNAVDSAKAKFNELGDTLSPVQEEGYTEEEEALIAKKRVLIEAVALMKEAKLDTSNFTSIAKFSQEAMGREKFVRVFDDFKDLYNLTKINPERAEVSYDDIFLTPEEKVIVIESDAAIEASILMGDFYHMHDIEFDIHMDKTIKEFIESQGYTVNPKEDAYDASTKIKVGHNKIAWLAKKYKKVAKSAKTSKFNVLGFTVSKEEIDNTLNANADSKLLDFDEINVGSEITFVGLESVVNDDGSIVYADGRKVLKNGDVEQLDPVDIAPIGILHKGEVLKGAFLHTTEWINQDNIANPRDVKKQKKHLTTIRAKVLEAGSKGITTTIQDRSEGHLLRDAEGKEGTVQERLPNATLAIGKDGSYYTGKKSKIEVINDGSSNAMAYVVLPVNKGKMLAMPARQTKLSSNPEYVESVVNAVQLYLLGDTNDERTKQLFNDAGIDITTITGLRSYISKFIYVNPKMDDTFEWEKFKPFVENLKEDKSIVRVTANNIEFGRGMNVGNTIGFLNKAIVDSWDTKDGDEFTPSTKDRNLGARISALRNVLSNNTFININKNSFGSEFVLPIITADGVKTTKQPYDTFAKENLRTDLYSHTLDTGKEIYTVQANLQYDTTFAFREEETLVEEEGELDQPTIIEDNSIEISDGDDTFTFDPSGDWGAFSPKEMTDSQSKEFEFTIPNSLFVTGVPINIQDSIVNHLSAKVIKALNEDEEKDTKEALKVIPQFKNFLRNAVIPTITKQSQNTKDVAAVKNMKDLIQTLENIISEYDKIEGLALSNLQTNNGILQKGEDFVRLSAEMEEGLIELNDYLFSDETKEKEKNSWSGDSMFTVNPKLKIGERVKNFFSYIDDASGTQIVNGKRVGIPVKGFIGMPLTVSFDQVINEVTALLAYSNAAEQDMTMSTPTIEAMTKQLEQYVESKPYLINVINTMETMDEQTKNQFVSIMSKHYTQHMYIFKDKKGKLYMNNSDSNNVIAVVQEDWINNLMQSDAVLIKDGAYILNPTFVTRVHEEASTLKTLLKTPDLDTDSTEVLTAAKTLFDSLGFKFSTEVITKLATEGLTYSGIDHSLLSMLDNKGGAFKEYLDTLKRNKGTDIQLKHPFENNSSLTNFSRELGKLFPMYFASSFKDVRGRGYFSYSNNKFLTQRFQALKEDSALLDKVLAQPFANTSYWGNQLRTNEEFKNFFGYYTVDGLSQAEVDGGKKMHTMSPAELEELKLGFFFAQNGRELNPSFTDYRVNLFYPTTSNKDVPYGIKTLGLNFGIQVSPNTGELTDSAMNMLFTLLVVPEINRIISVQTNPKRYNRKGYAEGGTMFNTIPALNSLNSLWITEDGHRELSEDILTDPKKRGDVINLLRGYVNELTEDKLATWETYGFIEENEQTGTRSLTYANTKEADKGKYSAKKDAYNVVLNYLVANTNVYQMFTTDPAFYWKSGQWKTVAKRVAAELGHTEASMKTAINEGTIKREDITPFYNELREDDAKDDWVQEHEDLYNNMGKRLAADVAPGTDFPNSNKKTFSLGHLEDIDQRTYLLDYYTGLLGNGAKDYFRPNGTDAQEFTTLAHHLELMVDDGLMTKEEAKAITDLDKADKPLSEKQMKGVLNSMKLVYSDNIFTEGLEHRLYVKSSSFPLFKQLTKGLEIDKLRVAMENQKVDRVAFGTAIKIGGLDKATKVYKGNAEDDTADGSIVDGLKIKIISADIPRKGLRRQQAMPFSENTTTVNDGTQQRKLLTSVIRHVQGFKIKGSKEDYSGQDIQDELDEAYHEIYKIKFNALVKELGFNVDEGTIDIVALQKVLKDEALERNYPLYDIEALNLTVDKNGEENFLVPLWLTSVAPKLEAMLNSIVDNRVRKIKPKGKSFILGASSGFKPVVEGKDATAYMNSTQGIIYDKDWLARPDKELLNMRVEDSKGRLRGAAGFDASTAETKPAEIMVAFKFKDDKGKSLSITQFLTKDTDGGLILDTEKMSPEILELFAFRIPTQGLNSMSYVKIVGFLPDASGDLMLAPSDWTVQMGSDFDIDKVYTNSYNTSYIDGKLTRFTTEHKKDRLGADDPKDVEKHLENTLLDLHFSILGNTNEEVQAEIMRPLDFGNLPTIIDEVFPFVKGTKTGIGMSEQYQTQKYLNARAGKGGIGVFSTDSTFVAVSQGKDLVLRRFDPSKRKWVPYVVTLGGETSNTLSDPAAVGKSGRTKAQVIAAFQSLSVDDENEQGMFKLNVNTHTFAAIRTMTMLGFEEDIIAYLINQPIIRDFVRLKVLADDGVTAYTKDQAAEEIQRLYPSDGSSFGIHRSPSKEVMLDMIQKPNPDKDVQSALLEVFKEFTEYGEKIQGIQSTINTDSAGLGKDLFYSITKEEQLLTLPEKSFMLNAEKLIGDYVSLEYGQGREWKKEDSKNVHPDVLDLVIEWYNAPTTDDRKKEILKEVQDFGYVAITNTAVNGNTFDKINLIKPETINGFASVYGLLLNNRVWEQFFPYKNKAITDTITTIKNVTGRQGRNIVEDAEISRVIFRDIKSHIISKATATLVDGDMGTERARLLMDTDKNKSIASIVKYLSDTKALDNPFISRLKYDINKEILPSTVIYKANIAENLNERSIYAAVASMILDDTTNLGEFNGIQYTPKKIIQDLIAEQYISGGIQKSTQFIKYIPINYLKSVGFYDFLEDTNFRDTSLSNPNSFSSYSFVLQYLQHNPKSVKNDIGASLEAGNGEYRYKNDKTIIFKDDINAVDLPAVFSIPDNTVLKRFRLYSYDSVAGHWEQVDTLGAGQVAEYNGNNLTGESVIPSNQVPEVVTIDVPKTPKEVKKAMTVRTTVSNDPEVVYDPTTASIVDTYDLNSTETSEKKMSTILETIVSSSENSLNRFMAQELHNNLDKLKGFRLIINPTLEAQGSMSLLDKTIMINPNHIKTKDKFETVFIEEVIHAYTKQAIETNSNGEVLRLKGLTSLAKEAVKASLGSTADAQFAELERKLSKGVALTAKESNLLYPVNDPVEFVGRLFKSKKLQQLLNDTPTDVKGVSMLDKVLDFLVNALKSVGIDIKKGNALDYAFRDIVTLINQPSPSPEINREIKERTKVTRTKAFVIKRYGLQDAKGNNRKPSNPQEVADTINDTINGIKATVVDGSVILTTTHEGYLEPKIIEEGKQLGLFDDSLSQEEEEEGDLESTPASSYVKSIQDRIHRLETNIEKAEDQKDFKKAEELREVLTALITRRDGEDSEDGVAIGALHLLSDIAKKGEQDMAELTEMFNRKVTLEDTLYINKVINFWSTATETMFTAEDRQSEMLTGKYKAIEAAAEVFKDRLIAIETKHMEAFMKQYGVNASVSEIFNHFKDINSLQENVLDISRVGNGLLDSSFLAVKEANIDAVAETRELLAGLEEKENKVTPILKAMGKTELFDIYRQTTDSGNITGHIVGRYSASFQKERRSKENDVFDNNSFYNYSSYVQWAKENTRHIDLTKLFPFGEPTAEQEAKNVVYRDNLKKELGETEYAELISEQTKLLKQYEARKEGKVAQLLEKYDARDVAELQANPEAQKNFNNWYYVHSPYAFYDQMQSGNFTGVENFSNFTSFKYAYSIPSKDSSYDSNFEVIESNPDLKDFYNYYKELDSNLKQWMNEEDRAKLSFEGIPFIQQNLLDQYRGKGMKAGFAPIWDGLKTAVRTNQEGFITNKVIDPVTEVEEQRLGVNLSSNNSQEYRAIMVEKNAEYLLDKGEEPSNELIATWKEETINQLAQKKSYDLPKVMRVYAMTVLAYKHKAKVEDNLRLAQNVLSKQQEFKRNNKGVILEDGKGVRQTHNPSTSFLKTKGQFGYFVDTFYGKGKKLEGVTNKKVYTKEEKVRKKNFESLLAAAEEDYDSGKLSEVEYNGLKATLEDSLNDLGGVAVWSKRGDALLKYVQLKSMGWNLMSAFANAGFGYIANRIEGSGGKNYTREQLRSAYWLVKDSVIKNASFGTKEPGESKKIRTMMDKWDVLQTAKTELFQSPLDLPLPKELKALSTYALTERTEYVNQAPIMIAMMMNTPATKADGTESTVWEAYDEDGNWKEEFGEEPTAVTKKLQMNINQVNKMNHGNYDLQSPLKGKNSFGGRALSQFRTWLFEGVAARVEGEKEDILLGTRKGRYRSVYDYFNTTGLAGIGGLTKAIIRDVSRGKLFKDADFEGDVNNDTFKEIDSENMRKVATEMLMYIELYGAYLLLAMAAADLDDDDKRKYLINSMINQSIRLRTDIMFYINPVEFKNFLRDLVPAASIIKDFQELGSAVYKFGIGEDEIASGVNAGQSRLLREIGQALPIGTQIYKTVNYSVQTFD